MTEAAAAFARARERMPWLGWVLAFLLPLVLAVAVDIAESGTVFPGALAVASVLLVALLGGVRAGLVATALNAVVLWWAALLPKSSFGIDEPRSLVGLGLMVLCGVGTSYIVRWLDRAEESASATARLLDSLLSNAPIGFAYYDRDLRLVLMNDALATMTNVDPEQHIGHEVGSIIPALQATTRGYMRRVMEERQPILGIEIDLPDPNGAPAAHWLANYYPVLDGRRRVVGIGLTVSDVTDARTHLALEQLARADAERFSGQLEGLLWVTDVALGRLPLHDLLEELMHRVRTIMSVDAVRIQLVRPGNRLGGGGAIGLEAEVEQEIDTPIGVGVSGTIAATRAPLVIEDLSQVEIASPVLASSGLTSLAGVPLLCNDQLVGVMHVATLNSRTFTSHDIDLLLRAAERVATAIDRTQVNERERAMVATLQSSLLPREMPSTPRLDVAAHYEAAGANVEVGGDFYDGIVEQDGSYVVFIGDVSGKGIEAAALTGAARHTMRAAARTHRDPAAVLAWLDEGLKEYPSDLYVTACFGWLCLEDTGARFHFSLGGHPRPVVRRANCDALFVGEPGSLVGIIDNPTYTSCTTQLDPGDLLLLYTDGVTDVPGSAGVTDDELLALVRSTHGSDPHTTVADIREELARRHAFEQRVDDTALVAIRVTS